MKSMNAIISKADVHFYPDLSLSQIELTLRLDKGNAVFRAPMDSDSMFKVLNVFNKNSIHDLTGEYCRVLIDEETGRVDCLKNIVFDEFGEFQNDPMV